MIQHTKSAQIADLTTLAVRAKNLQAGGSAAGTAQPKASELAPARAVSRDGDHAVRIDERTRQLADVIARQGGEGDAGGALRPSIRRPLFDAQAEMLQARTETYLHLVESRKRLLETIRLHEETGKIYSVQPNGNFEMDARGLEQHGGAEAFMQDIRQMLDRSHTFIAEAAKALGGSSSE